MEQNSKSEVPSPEPQDPRPGTRDPRPETPAPGVLRLGVRLLLRHKKAILFGYLANLMVAVMLLPSFMQSFDRSLGDGIYRERLLERLDYDWYELFRDRIEGFAATFSPAVTGFGPFAQQWEGLLDGGIFNLPYSLLGLAALYLIVNSFVTAAVIGSVACDPQGTTVREFFRTGGEFFGRFFRISILSLLCFGTLYWLLVAPLKGWIGLQVQEMANDRAIFYWQLGGFLAAALLFAGLNMIFDYTRLITALSDRTSIILACFSSCSFCLTRVLRAAGLYLVLVLLSLAWMVAMVTLESAIHQTGFWTILLGVLLQQVYLAGRIGIRYLFYTAQLELYLKHEGLFR